MDSMERMEALSELGGLLETLSSDPHVYVRHGLFPDDAGPSTALRGLAAQVHALVAELHTYWRQYASGGTGLASVPQIEAGLEPFDAGAAVDLMTTLAVDDLVWPGSAHMDRDEARRTATRVVELLGQDATWWANRDAHSSYAVTACTADGVIAGSDGARFAILIQVGED
ncbi:hypothetical protein [Streptomyces sp. NPDC017993]|uniref:hypothetical protein n=1 Tax=Streptomyces sp. NPDC017993 TaxID=3365027 RepID=UPI00379001FB